MAAQTIDELNDANFEHAVLRGAKPTIVQFWAPWSLSCQRACVGFETLAEEFDDAVAVFRLNVDDHPQTATNYSVTNLPSFVLFEDGATTARVSGSASPKALRRLFEKATS